MTSSVTYTVNFGYVWCGYCEASTGEITVCLVHLWFLDRFTNNNNNNTICIAPIKSEDTDTEALGGAGLSPAKQMCL